MVQYDIKTILICFIIEIVNVFCNRINFFSLTLIFF